MKKIVILIIKIYQKIPGNFHNYCRHIPTCSNYMIEAVDYYGVIKGIKMGLIRISKCRPNGTFGYDPVIKKEGYK